VTPVQGTPAAHSHGEGHGVTTTASGQEGRRWAPADEHGGGLLGSALRVAHRRTGRWQHKGARSCGTAAYLLDWGRMERLRDDLRPWRGDAMQCSSRSSRSSYRALIRWWRRVPGSAPPSPRLPLLGSSVSWRGAGPATAALLLFFFLGPGLSSPPLLPLLLWFLVAVAAEGEKYPAGALGFPSARLGSYRRALGLRRLGRGRTADDFRRPRRDAWRHPGLSRWVLGAQGVGDREQTRRADGRRLFSGHRGAATWWLRRLVARRGRWRGDPGG
jgi:hypothetical protein